MKSRIHNKLNTHKIIIYSDDSINATHKYTINHDTNILFITEFFKNYSIGTVHLLLVKNTSHFIEATVSFNSNIAISHLKKAGLFFKIPVLIPSTNVYIQIT